MEVAACIVAVAKRVVVQHIQSSMGNYELLRLLSKHMPRFLAVLGGANTTEQLVGEFGLHGLTKDSLTICLITISIPNEMASGMLSTLHSQFCAIFQATATDGTKYAQVTPTKDLKIFLKPEEIYRVLSSDVKELVRPQLLHDLCSQAQDAKQELPPKGHEIMRDNQRFNDQSSPKLRIEDVQLYFGMVLESAIGTFNKTGGEGECKVKPLSLAQLMSEYHAMGEQHVREVVVPDAVSTLLLNSSQIATRGTSKDIDRGILVDFENDRRVNKFLLLGMPKSGRHTLLKQMKVIYGSGFSDEERSDLRGSVYSTVVEDLAQTVTLLKTLSGDIAQQFSAFTGLAKFLEDDYPIFLNSTWDDCLRRVLLFWNETGVLEQVRRAMAASQHKITRTTVNAAYWLDRIAAVLAPDYLPSTQDVLFARDRSRSGVSEYEYVIDGNQFRMIVPEQHNRKKWIHHFEDVTALLIIADVSTYNQTLPEDDSVNALTEASQLFDELANSRFFRDTSIILFLTGRDVFSQQMKSNPSEPRQYFPDMNVKNYEEGMAAFEVYFLALHRSNEKYVYTHIICTTDTNNIRCVMDACKDIVIRCSLSEAGLCGGGGGGSYYRPSRPAATSSNVVVPANKLQSPKRKPKKKDKIDNVFADMENVFNGMADLANRFETPFEGPTQKPCLCFYNVDRVNFMRWITVTPFVLFLVYVSLSVFAVVVLLPCTFWLLIVRTTKVEREVETGFAVRQEVLAKETWSQKACRFVSLLRRSIPMNCLLVVWPLVIVLGILPAHPDLAMPLIGSQLLAIAVLQILGCVRGLTSWIAANRAQQAKNCAMQAAALKAKADKAALMMPSPLMLHDSSAILLTSASKSNLREVEQSIEIPRLGLCSFTTWKELINLSVEALQLACVGLQDDAPAFTSALLVQPVQFVPEDARVLVQASSSLIACACVLALLLLFCIQLIKEVRVFGKLKQSGKQAAANKFFFHSFVGTITYGHGEMKGVSCFVKLAVSTLSDALFLIVCANLLRPLTCTDDSCWTGPHSTLAALSLVALSLYVPLCAMIGPLLSESREGPYNPRDITIAQPFLSVVTITKFLLLLFVQFFFADDVRASPIASVLVCALMLGGMIFWTLRTGSSLLNSTLSPVSGLFLPINPPVLSIWKTLSFAAGVWGGIVAVVFASLATAAKPNTSLIVLFIGLVVLLVGGLIWSRVWSAREKEARLAIVALTLLLQGNEEVDTQTNTQAGSRLTPKQLPARVTGIEADARSQWHLISSA